MDPTTSSVAITKRPRKWRRARRITVAAPGRGAAIQVTIDGGPDGSWTRWFTPRSAGELLEQLTLDVDRLAERLWPAA
jgi:hypothetical protein